MASAEVQDLYNRISQQGTASVTVGSYDYQIAKANPSVFTVDEPDPFDPTTWTGWATIYNKAVPNFSAAPSTSGYDVGTIQTLLNRLPSSLPRLSVDGDLGPLTQQRVQEFQRQRGLPATGIIDAVTASEIVSLGGIANAGTPPPSRNNNPSTLPAINNYTAPPPPKSDSTSYIFIGVALLVAMMLFRD